MEQCCLGSHNLWRYFRHVPNDTQGLNQILISNSSKMTVTGKFSFEEDGLSCYCEQLLVTSCQKEPQELLQNANKKFKNYMAYINTDFVVSIQGDYHLQVDSNDLLYGKAHCVIKTSPHTSIKWKNKFRIKLRDAFKIII